MKHTIGITLAILSTIVSIIAIWQSIGVMNRVARAETDSPEEPSSPAHEGCGTFGDPQFHCTGGDCENGVLDPFRLDVPGDKVVCAVDWYFAGKTAPTFTHVSNGCSFGLCVFGMPFGQLRAFSSPHDNSVTGLRVWTEPREKRQMPVIMRDYPYPYPLWDYEESYP